MNARLNPGRDQLGEILAAAEEHLWADFRSSAALAHRGTKGTRREVALLNFLNDSLPTRFVAAGGEVIDMGGRRSGQVDIMIYDALQAAPLLTTRDGGALLGAEAVLAVIEVKSLLTKQALEDSAAGLRKLRDMRPWGHDWARYRPAGTPKDKGPRCFSSVFAFDTNLTLEDWSKKELMRIREVCASAGLHLEHLDRVAVLERGLLMPADGLVVSNEQQRRVLGSWYAALLHFLTRECARRDAFPWSDYESSEGRKWERVDAAAFTAPPPQRFGAAQFKKYKSGR